MLRLPLTTTPPDKCPASSQYDGDYKQESNTDDTLSQW